MAIWIKRLLRKLAHVAAGRKGSGVTEDELARRTAWFEQYRAAVDQGIHEPPQPGVLYDCPCCGYPTLEARGGYDICLVCWWEDDGQDDPRADEVWGGPNGEYSLSAARENFRAHGRSVPKPANVVEPVERTTLMAYIRRHLDGEEALDRDKLRELINAYRKALSGAIGRASS